MNKCEHGERISIFCASQCCAWKEPGGCELCMRKYHNHMGTTIFVSEDQVQVQVKKYQLDHSIKPKCRLLQEAIYNYFNLIKNEINNSIDLVCKNIINQIGYPFLYANNALSNYKRLKNKEYKKISQKEFRSFYQLSIKLNDKDLAKDESCIYLNQTKQTLELLTSLQALMHSYENISKKVNYTLNHDSTFMTKITDIIKSLNCESPVKTPPSLKSKDSQTKAYSAFVKEPSIELKNQFKFDLKLQSKVLAKVDIIKPAQKLKDNVTLSKHTRDVSLDQKIIKQRKFLTGRQGQIDNNGKIENLKIQLNQKQLEINQKKRQLLDMMKQKQDSPRRISVDKQKKYPTTARTATPNLIQLLPTPRIKEAEPQSSINDQKSSDGGSSHLEGGRILETASKNYAFTKLPLQDNRSQEKQLVKKKLIIIPALNDIKDSASKTVETDSPLYKKKGIINKFDQFKFQKEEKIIEPLNSNNKVASTKKQDVQLKENEEKSLALLLKSLNLKAEEAVTYLETALKMADNNLSAAEYLTYLYLQLNRPRDCLTLCNRILDRLQTSPQGEQLFLILCSNKAAALNVLGRYSQAIVIVERCLKSKQKDTLFKILGDSYFSIGIYDKATYNYEKAIKLNQMIDETHYNLAVCMYSQQNFNNAKLSIRKALQLQPKNQIYQQLLTNIESKIGQC